MNTDPSNLAKPISSLYHWNDVIADNLAYLLKELPGLSLPDDLQNELSTLCREFEWTVYDVRTEIRNLEDKLGLHPHEEPFDPNIANPDPKVTMGFIEDWVANNIQALDKLVSKLRRLAAQDEQRYGLVSLLVTESARNILQAQIGTKEDLKLILAGWEKKEGS